MLLFHGTSRNALAKIIEDGHLAPPVYLTNCSVQANLFAERAAKATGSAPCVLILETADLPLSADFSAYDEPLEIVRAVWANTDKDWVRRVDSGLIPYPSSVQDYRTSLKITGSVFIRRVVNAGRITQVLPAARAGMLSRAPLAASAA